MFALPMNVDIHRIKWYANLWKKKEKDIFAMQVYPKCVKNFPFFQIIQTQESKGEQFYQPNSKNWSK